MSSIAQNQRFIVRLGLLISVFLGTELLAEPEELITRWVLDRVECDNPEVITRLILSFWEDGETDLEDIGFVAEDLGDGTLAYSFHFPGGTGSFAIRPSYFYAKDGDSLRLFLESGTATTFDQEVPKLNGRYQIRQTWNAELEADSGEMLRAVQQRILFWTGQEYAEAYVETLSDDADDLVRLGVTKQWQPGSEDLYRKARRSWTHTVTDWDTLSQICERYATSMSRVMRQNGLSDPNRIQVGMILSYDSRLEQ